MLFRFLSKSSGRYAYADQMINAGNALSRSISGMVRNGRTLSNLIQKLSETVLNACKFPKFILESAENKAQIEQPETGALRQHGARFWLRFCACFHGGSVKGASPLVFICPLHIKVKNN